MSHREIEHDEIGRFAEGPPDWLRVQVTPPTLAPGSLQVAELQLIADQNRRGEGMLDEEVLEGLAESGWLRQDVQARGSYLSTSGLRANLDHPDLVMLNVPSGAVAWAVDVFEAMATYLTGSEVNFAPGEFFIDLGPAGAGAYTFAELGRRAAESLGFDDSAPELLVVIPLP